MSQRRRQRGDLLVSWAACCVCGSLFMRVGKRRRNQCSDQCKRKQGHQFSRAWVRRRLQTDLAYRAANSAAVCAAIKRRLQTNPELRKRRRKRDRDRHARLSQDPEYRELRRQRQRERRRKQREDSAYQRKYDNARVRELYWLKKETDPVAVSEAAKRKAIRQRQRYQTDSAYRDARRAYSRRYNAAKAATAVKITIGLLTQIAKDIEDDNNHPGRTV